MKKIVCILLMFCISISLVSCETQSKDNNVKEISGKVNILTTDTNEALINDAATLFKKKYPKVDIKVVYANMDKAMEDISNNSDNKDSLFDIMIVRDKNVPAVLNKFHDDFLDVSIVSQFKKDRFIKNQIDNNTYKNKIYGVPLYVEPTVMIYREDIFSTLNIKSEDVKTWKQYIDIGNNIVKPKGKAMLSSDYINNGTVYDLALSQLGVSYFNNDKKIDLLNEKSVRAAEIVSDIYSSKISQNNSDKVQSFVNGNTLSLICNFSTLYNIQSKYPDLSGKLAVQKIPAFEQGGNRDNINFGDNMMLSQSMKNNSAALEFVKFLSTDTGFSDYEFSRYGFISSNINSYVNDSFYKKNDFYKKNIGSMAIDEISGLRSMKYDYNFNIIRDKVLNTIIDTSNNNKPLNEGLYNLQNNLQNIE